MTFGKPFLPGQSGNPAGRKKGLRNKLGEAFIEALHTDFTANGATAIAACRVDEPAQYLKVIAGILPKLLDVDEESPLGQLIEGMQANLAAKLDRISDSEPAKLPEG